MDTTRAPTKKELLERLLEEGMVMVHLDARKEGVDVPEQFRADSDLRLNLSYGFRYKDLKVDGEAVSSTLSFGGRPYTCVMPMEAIFAIVGHATGEGYFFPTDAPAEALAALAAIDPEAVPGLTAEDILPEPAPRVAPKRTQGRAGAEMEDPLHPPPRRPLLRAIDGGLSAPGGDSGASGDEEAAAPADPVPTQGQDDGPRSGEAGEEPPSGEADEEPPGGEGEAGARRPSWLRVVK